MLPLSVWALWAAEWPPTCKDAGYDLTVYNRTRSKADALVAAGATWADSPAEAVRDADIVITMLAYA